MAHLLNQMMEVYCKDYEALFCSTDTISSAAINVFVASYNMFFRHSGFTWLPLLDGNDNQLNFAQIYAAADQVYIKSCRVLNRQQVKSILKEVI